MGNRSRSYVKPKEVLTPEQKVERKKKDLLERQRRRTETESTHDGRPSDKGDLLSALIKEHPERDPAKIK